MRNTLILIALILLVVMAYFSLSPHRLSPGIDSHAAGEIEKARRR
jgi:hypothetical protein